jgi:ABC-type transport system involved in multi-copper enzyme maturation permease subunit
VEARIAGQEPPGGKLHDLGYRKYTGARKVGPRLWKVIAARGLRSTIRTWYVILILTMAGMFWGGLAVWCYGVVQLTKAAKATQINAMAGQIGTIATVFLKTASIEKFFAFIAALFIGSAMLSDDFRTGGVAFYFARPITRGVYLTGKLVPMLVIVACITGVPPLLLALETVGVSGDPASSVLFLQVALHTAITVAALCAPAAFISSLVKNRLLGAGVYFGVYFGSMILGGVLGQMLGETWAKCFSISEDIHVLGQVIYGQTPDAPPLVAAGVLTLLIGGSLAFAYQRLRTVDILG